MFCNHQNILNKGDCNLGPTIITLLDVYYNLVLYCWMAWCREEFTCDVHDESNNLIVLPFYGCREGYSRAYVIVFSCGGCCQAEVLLCLCG